MKSAYVSLAVQTIVGGIIMYLVMFVMVDSLGSFFNNLNMFYMTLMMVAPMVVMMILSMRRMFPSKGANTALLIGSFAIFFRLFRADPNADNNRRHRLSSLDDPAPRGGDPDVPGSIAERSATRRALRQDHQVAA